MAKPEEKKPEAPIKPRPIKLDDATAARFVTAWTAAACAEDAGRAFNTDSKHASNFAAKLRKKGVPLKKFTALGGGRKSKVDFAALARLVK